MATSGMDNGEFMARRTQPDPNLTALYNALLNQYPLSQYQGQLPPPPEDTTGLKLLEEFLARRRAQRDPKPKGVMKE